jgi:YVTN family beta-propeller protein
MPAFADDLVRSSATCMRHARCCWPSAILSAGVLAWGMAMAPAWAAGDDARSTTIALNRSGTLLFVANREADSLTIFEVDKSGDDVLTKLDEVRVGEEPVCVAADGQRAFVANAVSGTVSVVQRIGNRFEEVAEFPVGTEPRGCALRGKRFYVTNFTEGTVAVVDTQSREVVDRVDVGGNPYGITIVGKHVFVTQFFARLIDGGPGEGFDDGKEGVVQHFLRDDSSLDETTLAPLADSGFTANRVNLCQQFNPMAANNTFCPDPDATDPNDPVIAQAVAGVFPNQLKSALACDGLLYLPNVGAQPEPPVGGMPTGVNFNTNVQALVHVVDIASLTERQDLTVNLNQQIAMEPAPDPVQGSLARLFGNEIVAMDADDDCENFFILSRGGNYVLKAQLVDGKLDIGAPDNVVRFQTGNIPTGIVVDEEGELGFVNNQVNMSVSVLDLEANTVLARDVPSSTPPEPGTFDHTRIVGQLVFFTALGVPDNGLVGMPVRDIIPLDFRGKQSLDAWSSCGSCHDEGLADGVTWIFGDGPRQTIPMDGLYSKVDGAHDTRINNWSAARDCVTDFNNNSRGVQGGVGFASDPPFSAAMPNPNIFDHGICQGASEALDFETTWAQTIRTLNAPQPDNPDDLDAGAAVFEENCASCHGGAKWTKSQVLYANNPGYTAAVAAGGVPRDPGVAFEAAQIISYLDLDIDPDPLRFLEPNIGAFDPANPIEIRQNGAPSLGALGLNVPSLLGVGNNAPYFHNGLAQTLEQVFEIHQLPGGGTIADLGGADDLLDFVAAIDGRTDIFRSDADRFHEPVMPPMITQ